MHEKVFKDSACLSAPSVGINRVCRFRPHSESHMDFDRQLFTETFTGWADDSTGGWFFFIDLDTSEQDSGSKYSFGYNNT